MFTVISSTGVCVYVREAQALAAYIRTSVYDSKARITPGIYTGSTCTVEVELEDCIIIEPMVRAVRQHW